MPPPPKSNPARRNKSTTSAKLSADHNIKAPTLPKRKWHPQTRQWWRDVWASPMAPEFDESDRHGLLSLARLVDDFWWAETPRDRSALAAEIRLQRQCFGLTPVDRRRLQWEIERTEEAQEKGTKRRTQSKPKDQGKDEQPRPDPRAVLHAVP